MKRKSTRKSKQAPPQSDTLLEAEKVLQELVSQDPRFAAAKKVARSADKASSEIGVSAARAYRQHLKR